MQLLQKLLNQAFKKLTLIPSGFTPQAKQQPKSEQTTLNLDHVVEEVVKVQDLSQP